MILYKTQLLFGLTQNVGSFILYPRYLILQKLNKLLHFLITDGDIILNYMNLYTNTGLKIII